MRNLLNKLTLNMEQQQQKRKNIIIIIFCHFIYSNLYNFFDYIDCLFLSNLHLHLFKITDILQFHNLWFISMYFRVRTMTESNYSFSVIGK